MARRLNWLRYSLGGWDTAVPTVELDEDSSFPDVLLDAGYEHVKTYGNDNNDDDPHDDGFALYQHIERDDRYLLVVMFGEATEVIVVDDLPALPALLQELAPLVKRGRYQTIIPASGPRRYAVGNAPVAAWGLTHGGVVEALTPGDMGQLRTDDLLVVHVVDDEDELL